MELLKKEDNILLVTEFITVEECNYFIELSEKRGYEHALVETEKGFQRIEGTRNNDRVLFTDPQLSEQLFNKASPFIPKKIGLSKVKGLNELFRFYRYEPGQQFKKHHDQSFIRNENEASYYTFMIYLNDNFTGGETIFNNCIIQPKQGSLLIFLHQLEHEGNVISKGKKYVLRTDIMYSLEI